MEATERLDDPVELASGQRGIVVLKGHGFTHCEKTRLRELVAIFLAPASLSEFTKGVLVTFGTILLSWGTTAALRRIPPSPA